MSSNQPQKIDLAFAHNLDPSYNPSLWFSIVCQLGDEVEFYLRNEHRIDNHNQMLCDMSIRDKIRSVDLYFSQAHFPEIEDMSEQEKDDELLRGSIKRRANDRFISRPTLSNRERPLLPQIAAEPRVDGFFDIAPPSA